MTGIVERGLPIMLQTKCKVGTHMFVVAGAAGSKGLPERDQRCDCGLVTFAEVSPTTSSQDNEGR